MRAARRHGPSLPVSSATRQPGSTCIDGWPRPAVALVHPRGRRPPSRSRARPASAPRARRDRSGSPCAARSAPRRAGRAARVRAAAAREHRADRVEHDSRAAGPITGAEASRTSCRDEVDADRGIHPLPHRAATVAAGAARQEAAEAGFSGASVHPSATPAAQERHHGRPCSFQPS